MTRSLLPPRGIFVPTHIIFHPQLPSAVLVTWIRLRCLAWEGWVTPPLSISELASLTGIHPARLHRHMSQLQGISALSWRAESRGKIIVSFPNEPSEGSAHHFEPVDYTVSPVPNSRNSETLLPGSYFPARILGYLSFDEEDAFTAIESSANWERETSEVKRELLNVQNCIPGQPPKY